MIFLMMCLWQAYMIYVIQHHFSMLLVDIFTTPVYILAMQMMFPKASTRQQFEYGVTYFFGSVVGGLVLLIVISTIF